MMLYAYMLENDICKTFQIFALRDYLKENGTITKMELIRILNENAPKNEDNRFQKITLTKNKLREYFPVFYTKSQMENVLFKLLEDWKKKDAKALTDRLSRYLIPTVKDIPVKTRSVIMEMADPIGPYGARGMGEMPYLPFAAGVLEAVYQAIDVRFDAFPLTDETVLRGLGKLPAHEVGFWDYE